MKTASSYTSTRYIPVDYREIIIRAAYAWGIAHPCDPFAQARMRMQLTNKNCTHGLASDVLNDAIRMMGTAKAKEHKLIS